MKDQLEDNYIVLIWVMTWREKQLINFIFQVSVKKALLKTFAAIIHIEFSVVEEFRHLVILHFLFKWMRNIFPVFLMMPEFSWSFSCFLWKTSTQEFHTAVNEQVYSSIAVWQKAFFPRRNSYYVNKTLPNFWILNGKFT